MIPPVLPTYARAPLAFVSGEGPWLTEAGVSDTWTSAAASR